MPYIEHPMAVAMILDRAGFAEEVVIAGLLHDVVEDTDATLDEVRGRFGDRGRGDRRRTAPRSRPTPRGASGPGPTASATTSPRSPARPTPPGRSILADKLHNLLSIRLDLARAAPSGRTSTPTATRSSGITEPMIDACGGRATPGSPALADESPGPAGRGRGPRPEKSGKVDAATG